MKLVWAMMVGSGLLLGSAMAVSARAPQEADVPAAAQPVPISDGPTLFRVRGCAQCHEIRGVGGHKGPDLSGVGRRLKKDMIERQIVSGGDAMPAFGEAIPGTEIEALVKYLDHCRDKTPKIKPATKPAGPAAAPDTSQPTE